MLEHTLNDTALVKLNVSNLSNKLYIDQLYRGFYIPGASRRMELSLKKFI
jgi:catecholate siderophore receptor